MSYVINFWQLEAGQSKPASLEATGELLDELHEQPVGDLLSKFRQLAKNLMAACPDPEDAEPEDAAWPEAPLYGDADCAVWSVTPNLSMIDELMPIMVQQAHALGLSVTDPQAGISYCPGDKIDFGSSQNNSDEDEEEYSPRNKEVLPLVIEGLRPIMEKHGYKAYKRKRCFKREFAEGWGRVDVWSMADSWPLYAEFVLFIQLRCHPIERLIDPDASLESRDEVGTLRVNFDWFKQTELCRCGIYRIKHLSQIDQALDELVEQLESLLPILAKIETVENFDSVLNIDFEDIANGEPPEGKNTLLFGLGRSCNIVERTVAAYLTGNPILASLCEFYSRWGDKRQRILELTEFFKENPRPVR